MGKYIRHGVAVLAAAIMGAILPLLGLEPSTLDPEVAEQVGAVTAALETILYFFFTLLVYPVVEKFLKRFAWLDLEGFAGRVLTKQKAAQLEPAKYAGKRLP